MKKVVVAIPEQQHSYELISSLRRLNYDITYITTVYFKENSRMLRLLKMLLPSGTYQRAKKHHCDGIEDERVLVFFPLLGLFQLLAQRLSIKLYRSVRSFKWKLFQYKLLNYVNHHRVDILVLYEDYADYLVEKLKNQNIKIVIDCCAASKQYMKKIYENDSNGANIDEFKREYPILWNGNDDSKTFLDSDYIMVPSEFSKSSYEYLGIPIDKIKKIGYPLSATLPVKENYHSKGVIRFMYAGQVTYRKGIHWLLEAFSQLSKSLEIELFLYGTYDPDGVLYKNYKDNPNIYFKGWILKERLFEEMISSDVFIFPSLADSMSFSCLEAMMIGLPVICTSNTGASDYIDNYNTGIIIDYSSLKAIKDVISWCACHRLEMNEMGVRARVSVADRVSLNAYDKGIDELFNHLTN